MKHICIEGGDGLGKNSLIKSICDYYNYNNVTIRHFDKPPKGLSPKETLDFQFSTFYKEFELIRQMEEHLDSDEYGYHENVVIWNRSHLGEYVYSQMFRSISRHEVATKIKLLEERNPHDDRYLITLTASPKFFFEQEDGDSFSQDLDQKTKELQLFKEVHALSSIPNKKLIKVNEGNSYRGKDVIFDDVLQVLNK